MEPLDMLFTDPLDILFENRNKSYGAYPLRKYYNQRLLISMGVMFSLVLFTSLLYLFCQKNPGFRGMDPVLPEIKLTQVDLLPRIDKPAVPAHPPVSPLVVKPPASNPLNTPVITTSQQVPTPLPTVDELQDNAIGPKTTSGDPDNGQPKNYANGNASSTEKKDSAENIPEIYRSVEIMPEFPGGLEALKRYLSKNLRMPETNLEAGIRIRVTARFVVGADGKVRDIEITQAAEDVFNAEVKRVILKMPDWKPGEQNHRHVAVYFSLPVNFVTEEE
jgi:periplasmic protein TonB